MRYFVIDGYNVLRSSARYRDLSAADIDSARAKLVADASSLLSDADGVTIVFDGGGNPSSDGSAHEIAGLGVVFSRFGIDADTVIEEMVAQYRSSGHKVVVVTSDEQTQWVTMGPGVVRMSASEFGRQIDDEQAGWPQESRSGPLGSTIDERIDPKTRDTLARWARSGS